MGLSDPPPRLRAAVLIVFGNRATERTVVLRTAGPDPASVTMAPDDFVGGALS